MNQIARALQPYPEYRDSGVPWLGDVPAHWRVQPGFSTFRQKQQKNVGLVESTVLSLSYGRIIVKPVEKLHGLVPASFETYQIVNPGDIIVRPTDLQNDWTSLRVGIARDRGIITSAYLCLQPIAALSPDYLFYLLHSYDLLKVFYGMGSGLRQNLDFSDLKRMPVVVPPPSEQAAIVRFLEHIDRRVNRFVRAKRRLVALLNEQKQAIIHRAVTRGLDPDVPLKPSGVAWLPEIPKHWSSVRLGTLAKSLQTGPFGSQLHAQDYVPNGIPVINPSHMRNGLIFPDANCAVTTDKFIELSRHTLLANDIIFARRGELGRCALVGKQEAGWLCGTGSLRMRLKAEVAVPKYLLQLFLSKGIAEWLSLQSVGSTMENLNTGILARMPLPLPPKDEQQSIVDFLKEQQSVFEVATSPGLTHYESTVKYATIRIV